MEFPRKTRYAAPVEPAVSVPAWRAELSEKVRAIRAKRTVDPQDTTNSEQVVSAFESDTPASVPVQQQPEPAISYSATITPRKATSRTTSIEQTQAPVSPSRRTSSNIVEAALIRVKRASENASRAALPKIEPARTMPASAQVGLALGATARALEPEPEIEAKPESNPDPVPTPRPELVQTRITPTPRIDSMLPEEKHEAPVATASVEQQTSPVVVQTRTLVLDEIEPVDYLEAEIRKVDQAYGAAFLRNESASVFTHAVIFAVDVFALAASCSPFLAIIRIADGNFATPQTRFTAGAIVVVITFFYLALTQSLCGRTFGMMLTNTRIVDASTFEAPSPARALARTAGYFLAAAPAMLGFIWTAFNRRRRGWQDFISGTIVVRDF